MKYFSTESESHNHDFQKAAMKDAKKSAFIQMKNDQGDNLGRPLL